MPLADALRQHAVAIDLAQGGRRNTLSVCDISQLAEQYGLPGRVVEVEALKRDIFPFRYVRNMESITQAEQISLLSSSIAQVGLGGLGGILLDMFLRGGVGVIRGADGDTFEESNLNRQALATLNSCGTPKVDAAKARVAKINPSIQFEGHTDFLTPQSLPEFLNGADLVVDALGGLEMRLGLQEAAAQANIPLVTGAIAGWTGYVGVVLPGQTGPADIMGRDNSAEEQLGCPAPAVNMVAALMATEVIKILSGHSSELNASIFLIDLKSLTFKKIHL